MANITIKRFGETYPKAETEVYWYELDNGEKVYCDEEEIAKLWCKWVVGGNSHRADTDEFTIFEFINPEKLDLSSLVNWSK